jgi:o-succinylbenzoate synthase
VTIVGLRLLPFSIPLGSERVATARRRWSVREGLVACVEDEEGFVGQGEASPLPGYSPDTLDDARVDLAAWGLGLPSCRSPGGGPLDDVRSLLEESGMASPSARCALETALIDLHARREGVPLHVLLGARSPRPVALNALLPAGANREETLSAARAAWQRGVRCLKVKVGAPGAFERECSLVQDLRETLGPGAELRADANGAWSRDESAERLARLAAAGADLVEQPVPPGALVDLVDPALPVAADESLALPEALDALIARGVVEAYVLKPMILGGLLPCLDAARRVGAAGGRVIVTHLFSAPVGHAAAAELALACAPPPAACGLDASPVLRAAGRVPEQISDASVLPRPLLGHGIIAEEEEDA